MQTDLKYLYGGIGVAVAVAYGLFVGPFWRIDAPVLALGALAVAILYMKKADWSSPHELEREYLPRSRIAHYCQMSRMEVSPSILKLYQPFERKLLGTKGWRTMSFEQLRELAKAVIVERDDDDQPKG